MSYIKSTDNKGYKRHANGKIRLFYIPYDLKVTAAAYKSLTPEQKAELFDALYLYEANGAETMPQFKSEKVEAYFLMYLEWIEEARKEMQENSNKQQRNKTGSPGRSADTMKEI